MAIVQVKDRKTLVKDTNSGALLSTDKRSLNEYLEKKKMLVASLDAKEQINTVMSKLKEVDELKQEIKELKELLKGMLK